MTFAPEPAPPIYPPPPAPRKRHWGRIIAIIIAAVVALIVAIGVGVFLLVNESTADAQKVSDQLVTAVQNGDGSAAYALTGPRFRAVTTEADLNELVQRLSTFVTKEKASPNQKVISVSTETGKVAVFVYTLKGPSGSPVYFKTQIRNEDGNWQVLSFRSSETKLGTDIE